MLDEWLSATRLTGTRGFAFDESYVALTEQWQRPEEAFDWTIEVLFPFESRARCRHEPAGRCCCTSALWNYRAA
jgi:hypothetical protein